MVVNAIIPVNRSTSAKASVAIDALRSEYGYLIIYISLIGQDIFFIRAGLLQEMALMVVEV
ncbi:MAG: hypothetical protein V3W51_04210 [Candidatus Brocadiales bacterium]